MAKTSIIFVWLVCEFHLTAFSQAAPTHSPVLECKTDVVLLRIRFLASGKIGDISVIKGLPNGLTEKAIEAARKISFEPKKVNGVPQDVTRQIEYTFREYYEGDPIRTRALIVVVPDPKFPPNSIGVSGVKTINVPMTLLPNGKAEIGEIKGDWPKEVKDAAAKAASKITFKPAINKCGQAVKETTIINYEIK